MPPAVAAFIEKIGTPSTPGAIPFRFSDDWAQQTWEFFAGYTGVGAFMDEFLFLFEESSLVFNPLLDYWSFLFEEEKERWVIGKNAYGALLVIENPTIDGTRAAIGYVDPIEVRYVTHPELNFVSLLGRWLPLGLLPHFLDDSIYKEWTIDEASHLDPAEILAIKQPLSLEGKMTLSNFQVENIVDYYQSTAEVYKKYIKHDQDSSESE